jgi:hypothetical protein
MTPDLDPAKGAESLEADNNVIVPHKHKMVAADYLQGCHDGLYSRLDPRDK